MKNFKRALLAGVDQQDGPLISGCPQRGGHARRATADDDDVVSH